MKEFAEQGIPKSGLTAKGNLVLVCLDPEEHILPGVCPPSVLASSWTVRPVHDTNGLSYGWRIFSVAQLDNRNSIVS